MTIDIDVYIVNKDFIQRYALTKGKDNPRQAISLLSQTTFVPAIAVAYWVAEAHGYPEEVMKTIRSLISFYGYTDIKNKPEGAPE